MRVRPQLKPYRISLQDGKAALTMNFYTHTLTGQGAQGIDSLPDLGELPGRTGSWRRELTTGHGDDMSPSFYAVTLTGQAMSYIRAGMLLKGSDNRPQIRTHP